MSDDKQPADLGESRTPDDGHSPGYTTHFGFNQVRRDEKESRVRDVFDSVADRYDMMNDLMSGGLHRLWKRFTIDVANLRPGQRVLDVAAGSGDLSRAMLREVGREGTVVMSDINARMVARGRDRLRDAGAGSNCVFVQASAEALPFDERSFDVVTIAFGLRNVTDKPRALREMRRVLRPGGQLLVLEFSRLTVPPLQPLYDRYSFDVLPFMGKLVANDADSYRYLAESIRMHPDQDTLLAMMEDAHFARCRYHNLMGGVVAVHRGYRL
ncbi:MAG: bifunctional demethylmenaquinone methyltransferase/2-methoxy-6-polyprenyl-1,4-benzoquinol methylase UbiE [Pseudomonadota bacterium]